MFSKTAILPHLVLSSLVSALPSDGRRDRAFLESCIWFMATISCHLTSVYEQFHLFHKQPDCRKWYVTLSSTHLRATFGDNYTRVMSFLIDAGFLCRGRSYRKSVTGGDGWCKHYWMTTRYASYMWRILEAKRLYRSGRVVDMTVGGFSEYKITSGALLRRLKKLDIAYKERLIREDNTVAVAHAHLEHFRIDTGLARRTLKKGLVSGEMTAANYNIEVAKVNRFNSMDRDKAALYVKRDNYGRLHTNVTCIKSEVRDRCLFCDGMPTGAVDIKSSQASFLCSVFNEFRLYRNNPMYCSINPRIKLAPYWKLDGKGYADIDGELERFAGLLHSGHLYEFFMERMEMTSRRDAKRAFLTMLFDSVRINGKRNPERVMARRVWKQEFPALLRCIDWVKANNYAVLAHAMQAAESEFVFGRVIPRVEEEVGCHWCTVHDSIIVPLEHVDAVKRIVDEELYSCGIPTLTEREIEIAYGERLNTVEMMELESEVNAAMPNVESDLWMVNVVA